MRDQNRPVSRKKRAFPIVGLLVVLGFTAMVPRCTSRLEVVAKSSPSPVATKVSSPNPKPVVTATPMSEKPGPVEKKPSLVVGEGSGHRRWHSEERTWFRDGQRYHDGEVALPDSAMKELRGQILASRHPSDSLTQFDQEFEPEVVRDQMRSLYPWIDVSPPVVSKQELLTKARGIWENGKLGGSNIRQSMWLTLEGEPQMEVEIHTSALLGRYFSGYMSGLPDMDVKVGGQAWSTRSPDLARAILPFAPEKSYWNLYTGWAGEFLACEAGQRGERWAQDYILANYLTWPGGSELATGYRVAEFKNGALVLRPRDTRVLETIKIPVDPEVGLGKDWTPLVTKLNRVEERLSRFPWLSRVKGDAQFQLTFATPESYERNAWFTLGVEDKLSFVLKDQRGGGKTLLFGDQEPRVFIQFPREIAAQLGIAKRGHRFPDILVDESGRAVAVESSD